MKKVFITLLCLSISAAALKAQDKKTVAPPPNAAAAAASPTPASQAPGAQTAPTTPPVDPKAGKFKFDEETHDFGTVPEGPDATCEFTFKNNGKEPIVIEKAQPSCGCTVPQFSKEPVAPGATGVINVAYHTKGKPNGFTKTITVVSNAGTKVLTIKGSVEKAPTGSVPENVSMIKTN